MLTIRSEPPARPDRRPVTLRAFALDGEGNVADVMISNLGYDGCAIEGEHKLSSGDSVELRVIRLGAIQAKVRWAKTGTAGCEFIRQ